METVIYNTELVAYMYSRGDRKYLRSNKEKLNLNKKEKFFVLTNLFCNDKMKKGKLFRYDGEYTKISFNTNGSMFIINAISYKN